MTKRFFPLITGCVLACGLMFHAWFLHTVAPSGTVWLGDTIQNSSDVAVYFSYIRQITNENILIKNLYANEAQHGRIDPFWTILGFINRIVHNPILVHEITRALLTIILVYAVWTAARSLFSRDDETRLATLLAIGGISTGWIYSIWLGVNKLWISPAPDVGTEIAIFPALLGGTHAILSIALLVTSVRLLWDGIRTQSWKHTILGALTGMALLSFHAYFTPVLGAIIFFTVAIHWRMHAGRMNRILHAIVAGALLLPPIAYYLWLSATESVFAQSYNAQNVLPLNEFASWIAMLLPFFVALGWMWRTHRLPRTWTWASAWIFCDIALLLFLPIPWKRKLDEGMLIPLVFLCMPAWISVREWLRRIPQRGMRILLTVMFCFAAWLTPFNILTSDIAWHLNPQQSFLFYQPSTVLAATQWVFTNTHPSAITLSDSPWLNTWLPALDVRPVWVGHGYATTNYIEKHAEYRAFLLATSTRDITTFLDQKNISVFLTTSSSSRAWFSTLAKGWESKFHAGDVEIWMKNR